MPDLPAGLNRPDGTVELAARFADRRQSYVGAKECEVDRLMEEARR